MKRVAWVMVNHNGGEELIATVASLSADLTDNDVILLLDNGSEDDSAGRAAERFPHVQMILTDENLPFSVATNRGLSFALEQGYTWVGIINPDVRVTPGLTGELIRTFSERTRKERAAVSPVMTFGSTDRIWFAGGRYFWSLGWIQHRGMGKLARVGYRYRGSTEYLTGCCWLSPAEAWRSIGLLDEAYVFYAEDADWSLRAIQAGWELYIQPDAALSHNVSSSTKGRFSPVKMFYRTVMARRFFSLNTPPSMRILQKFGVPLMHLVYSAYLYLSGNRRALSVYREALKRKPTEQVKWPPSRETIISSY